MTEKNNVTEQLRELITVYGFNKDTLSKYHLPKWSVSKQVI